MNRRMAVSAVRTSLLLLLPFVMVACRGDDGPEQGESVPPSAEPGGVAAPSGGAGVEAPTPVPDDDVPGVGEDSTPAVAPGGGEPRASGATMDPATPTGGTPPGTSTPPGDTGATAGPGAAAAAGQDATAILTRAAARLSELRGFCGDFRQEIQVPLLGQTTRSAGRLCQQRPNLFAMDFTDPQGDRVVADGTWVWTYFPSTDSRQVVRFPLAEQGRMDFFQEFVAEPGVRYIPTLRGEELVGGRPAWRIALEPRDRTHFTGATVWIDRETSLLRKVEILQENGSTRVVELGELELNPTIPASRFTFSPPEGVQVYTPPTGGGG